MESKDKENVSDLAVKIRKNYWKKEEEDLIRQWADKAQCYQWLHMRSRDVYQKKNAAYTIPVIIISTFVGTANFAQERFPEENRKYVAMGVGTLSIVAGIISTVSQFLKVSELNEAHRIACLSWGKFYRTVKTEITRHPLDRNIPSHVITHNKEEFDRLVEISPPIPKKILEEFGRKFGNVKGLTKPEMCDQLTPTKIYEITDEERSKIISNLNNVNKEIMKKSQNKKITEKKQETVDKYKETFFNLNGRYPNSYEIQRYMEKINGDDPVLEEEAEAEDSLPEEDNTVINIEGGEEVTNSVTV